MTAEIIQFGKPQSATFRHQQLAATIKQTTRKRLAGVEAQAAGQRPQRRAPRISETVRFMFGAGLYEVEFCDDHVEDVNAIKYRITAGGVQEMKRHHWWEGCYCQHDLDPAMVQAARRARGSDGKAAELPFREAALAAFHKRRAKLISEVGKIDATLASMRCN